MTILRIKVENVKGAKSLDIQEKIYANKPSILVAPNGFGKSSITAAFISLNQSRLKLEDDNLHEGNESNKPSIILQVEDSNGTLTLAADENKNQIHSKFDIHVINSRLQAKANKRNLGNFTAASASLDVKQVVLVEKVPRKTHFNYKISKARADFGSNGKCLRNISDILLNSAVLKELTKTYGEMAKMNNTRIKNKTEKIKTAINQQAGDAGVVANWIDQNQKQLLEEIQPISKVADIIGTHVPEISTRLSALLCSYQICELYAKDTNAFKEATEYVLYTQEKEVFTQLISSFNTSWKSISPRETGGKLVVDFPQAMNISNGQRDSLVFASMIQKIKSRAGKKNAIIVIDEVFDYLDDANLAAAQYYISNLIDEFKKSGKKIYPLIFTHLSPLYFKNYTFQDQKVYFIDKRGQKINEHFQRLIRNRHDESIRAGVEKHHLHYCPADIDLQSQFEALKIKKAWGRSDQFRAHIDSEWSKYHGGCDDYDPFAVCCYVRVKIEEIIYSKIIDPTQQARFVDTHKTKDKLEFAKGIGIQVPEVCFLLGVIYNEGLHMRNNADSSSPIAAKLGNLIIRKMMYEATNG